VSVATETFERLRELMTSGELAAGTRLGEVQLASRLGVSRPTVREVLQRLEALGLAASDGRSLRVAGMDGRELRSALLTRAALEGLHAELAARRVAGGEVPPAGLRRLGERADDAERATLAGDHAAAVEHNRAFHQAIDAMAANPVGAVLVDRLWDRILVATERSLGRAGRAAEVNREHRELLGALAAGDAERAAALATAHVRATLEAAGDAAG
jgi:DNA-binding GntR family transcriptional regulator